MKLKIVLINLLTGFLGLRNIVTKQSIIISIKITIDDEERYQNSQIYWICNEKINNDKDKERDHCHITGTFRGAARKKCNLKLKIPRKLPVIIPYICSLFHKNFQQSHK